MRYKDEKYVEALEEEVRALRKALSPERRATWRGGSKADRAEGTSAVQTEELYRRARTEVAAEAGAGYGRVSLEALYLLPAEFTNAYQRLFLAALKESPGQTGEANPLVKKAPKLINKGDGETLDRDPDRGGGRARSNGRRHRDHWTIKDESAFRLKERIDGELRDLAAAVLSGLTSRAAGNSSRLIQADVDRATTGNLSDGSAPQTPSCPGCRKFLKASWKFCPHCGSNSGRV